MKKEVLQSIKVIALGLVLAFGINFTMAAWSEPQSTPTGDNTLGPITVGKIGDSADEAKRQKKYDGLNLAGSLSVGNVVKDGKGNVTDVNPPQSNVALDVRGVTHLLGLSNLGRVSIYPAGLGKGPDGQIFEVYGTDGDLGNDMESTAIFAVDTSAKSAYARNLTVRQNASILGDSVTYGENTANKMSTGALRVGYDAKFGEYDLTLKGTTNIGRGASCIMDYTDMMNEKGCPAGTYASFFDAKATTSGTYAKCTAFDTETTYSGKNCYTYPALALSSSIYEYSVDLGAQNNSVTVPYCKPLVDIGMLASGGAPGTTGYTYYNWFYKEPATKYQWQSIPNNACDGTVSPDSNGVGKKTCKIQLSTDRTVVQSNNTSESFSAIFTATVKDSKGTIRTITIDKTFGEAQRGGCK